MDALQAPVPPGWERAGEIDGVPLWRWRDEAFHAATRDMDQLLFVGAALTRFAHMSAEEFREYVAPLIRRANSPQALADIGPANTVSSCGNETMM